MTAGTSTEAAPVADGVRCMLMRGGTSKGAYFLATDLPSSPPDRDELLLRILGSGHPLQIDGIGGAHSLLAKIAVVSPADDDDADVDYLFLQAGVDQRTITDRQNCGNILAGVGPFAIERGLVTPSAEVTTIRIRMVNTGSIVTATVATPGGRVRYDGDVEIAGVPGTGSPIGLLFADTAGSTTGQLLPTGNVTDVVDGIEITCIDNGMPVVVARAADLGITGYEDHEQLAADDVLRDRIQSLRLKAGAMMGLGDVTDTSVPKTTLVAAARDGGTICTRTFIPLKVHTAIGVLGAVSAVTAVLLPGGVGSELATPPGSGNILDVEHPTGHLLIELDLDATATPPVVRGAGAVRTARKLFDGIVFPAPPHRGPKQPGDTDATPS